MRRRILRASVQTALRQRSTLLLAAILLLAVPASAVAQAEVVEYYATDALGSTRVVFDANGNVAAQADYLPFGEALGSSGALPPQRFTGQERDSEAGLDSFNARGLVVRTARFSTTDPIGGVPADPQSWNRYAYVTNNPLSYTDPSGMQKHSGRSCWYPRPEGWACYDYGPENDGGGGFSDPFGGFDGFPYSDGSDPFGGIGSTTIGDDQGQEGTTTAPTTTTTTTTTTESPPGGPAPPGPPVPEPEVCETVRRIVPNLFEYVHEAQIARAAYGEARAKEWWIDHVRPGGAWDVKETATSWHQRRSLVRKGNIVFGATGRVVGYTESQLIRGSMAVDFWQHGPGSLWGERAAAERADHVQIRQGIQFYDAGCRGR